MKTGPEHAVHWGSSGTVESQQTQGKGGALTGLPCVRLQARQGRVAELLGELGQMRQGPASLTGRLSKVLQVVEDLNDLRRSPAEPARAGVGSEFVSCLPPAL